MITTVIFDFSEVLAYGVMGSGKHLRKKLYTEITDTHLLLPELDQLFLGKISEDEYWHIVIKKNAWKDISINELKSVARKNFKEIKGTRRIIEKLKKNGYILALLSNHAREWVRYCEITYKYHQLFHNITYSYEVSLVKPSKEIFTFILKKLQISPQECLFIDDNIKNIVSAKELGFNTIQFTSAKNLKKELKKFNVKV